MGSEDGFLSSTLTLITFLLIVLLTCVEGQYRVIGSPERVTAAPGDDVILTCHLEPDLNLAERTVEWSKPDLPPDPRDRLKGEKYVSLYRHYKEDPNMQMEAYRGRTMLFKDELKHGNISLKIVNVSEEDGGRYRCYIPKLKGWTRSSIVSLIIETKPAKTGTTETPLDPRNHQTPKEFDDLGGSSHRSRLIPLVVFLVLVVLGVGSGLYVFVSKHQKSEVSKVPPL
ncbi:myelin-oligodendrocyte glycoprotein-like [Parambassis ranga]|uniref:Myelin-oligodendrocyte glycoprotein-like n=1 Tax=Parambassis ranga TaxID=210632 RepID=A0A6P7I0L1_9TELE|nr:myelin-oligodendrocyte glycoprotein-like [Parambassis ranga]